MSDDTIQKIADKVATYQAPSNGQYIQVHPRVMRDWEARLRALSARASAGEGVPEITPALAGWFIAALGDIPDDYQRITTEQVMEALRANVEHFAAAPQPAQAGASGGGENYAMEAIRAGKQAALRAAMNGGGPASPATGQEEMISVCRDPKCPRCNVPTPQSTAVQGGEEVETRVFHELQRRFGLVADVRREDARAVISLAAAPQPQDK